MANHQELSEEAARLTLLLEPIPSWLSVPLESNEGWWDKAKLKQALAHIGACLADSRNEEAVQQAESLVQQLRPIIERYAQRAVQSASRRVVQTPDERGEEHHG